jgi:hypothetical protein
MKQIALSAFVVSVGVVLAGCSDGNKSIDAAGAQIDAPPSFSLTVTSANGAVVSDPVGIDCPATCSSSFEQGTQVSLMATPDSNYAFTAWSGPACEGQGATCQLTLGSDTVVAATYEEILVPACNPDPMFDPNGDNGFARVAITGTIDGSPTDVAFVPNTGNYIVITQQGDFHYYDGGCDPKNSINAGDIGVPIQSGGERGLLNIEFHPDYATNGLMFVFHTSAGGPDVNSVTRLSLSFADGDMVLADPVRVIDSIKTGNQTNHNGGGLVFAPDKTMLMSVGEGGTPAPGQTTNDLLGAVMRIDPALTGTTAYDYTIPAGNMFDANNPRCYDTSASASDCPELLAIGLRNPFRMSIDGSIVYLGDVGASLEEIHSFDYTDNTMNFGWSTHQGTVNMPGFTDPILEYDRDQEPAITFRAEDPECGSCEEGSASVMIGPVYRGNRYGGMLDGHLIWGEYFHGYIRAYGVTTEGLPSGPSFHVVHDDRVDSMVLGPDGYVYLVERNTRVVYRIVRP